MMAQAPGQWAGRWLPLVRNLREALIEPAPPPLETTANASTTPAHRLSRSGEIALGLTITLLAVGLYGQTLMANQRLSQRFAFCQSPRSAELAQSEAARQTQTLISNLASATPSQKVRLAQQANGLVVESARLCGLAALNHGQEAALMTVATAALGLLSLTVALGLAHGLMNSTNRTLRTLQVNAVFSWSATDGECSRHCIENPATSGPAPLVKKDLLRRSIHCSFFPACPDLP